MADLLEYIFLHTNCSYISDIPRLEYRAMIIKIMNEIPEDAFTLRQWNDVFHYLTHTTASFESKDAIMKQLRF